MMDNTIENMQDIQTLVKNGKWDFKDCGEVYTRITHDLILFSYLPTCQFKEPDEWNYLERVSRGLILNRKTGEVVARPYEKFWNWGQSDQWTTAKIQRVYEKVDGSLGILYRDPHKNQFNVATRGSFESDQACWATELWQKEFGNLGIPWHWTILLEIIYPENRVVVDYGDWEGFYFLGAMNRLTGARVHFDCFKEWYQHRNLQNNEHARLILTFPRYDIEEIIEECENQEGFDFEGFVVEFADGSLFKFKGKEYLKAHRLISNLTDKNVHAAIMNNEVEEMREALPDEFIGEFDYLVNHIHNYTQRRFEEVIYNQEKILEILERKYGDEETTQKDYALEVQKFPQWQRSFLFMLPKHGHRVTHSKILQDYFKLKKRGIQI